MMSGIVLGKGEETVRRQNSGKSRVSSVSLERNPTHPVAVNFSRYVLHAAFLETSVPCLHDVQVPGRRANPQYANGRTAV